jgi:hypothetical protein
MKDIGKAFLRGLAYAIAFAIVFSLFPLIFFPSPATSVQSSSATDARTVQYWKDYEAQRLRTEQLLTRSERYYDRMDANAAKQEEINRRLEAVITRWETRGISAKQP